MKALMTLASMSLFAFATQSHAVTCFDHQIQDSNYTATFDLESNEITVKLAIPVGETEVTVRSGTCKPLEGAIELAVTCTVLEDADNGFDVSLFSLGGPDLKASVTAWSSVGRAETVYLNCK